MPRSTAVLAKFQSQVIGVAGYYAASDKYQHVIVATSDNVVTELWWRPGTRVGRTKLARFNSPVVGVSGLDGTGDPFFVNNVVAVSTADGNVNKITWPGKPVDVQLL